MNLHLRLLITAGLMFLAASFSTLAVERTWTGAANDSDWYNPANWSPPGMPDPADTLNVNGGTPHLSPPFTSTGQLNWTGGTLSGVLTVAAVGALNWVGPANKIMVGSLTNRGTINWLDGTLSLYYQAGHPPLQGQVWNQPGAVIEIQCDQSLLSSNGLIGTVHNAGLLRKSGQTGTTSLLASIDNAGTVLAQTGTISFNAGGELAGGIYQAAGGAQIYFAGGPFHASGLMDWRGPGDVCITGGSVELLDAAGTLAMCGGSIVGQSRLQGTLDWRGGGLEASGSLTVAVGGELNLAGSTNRIIVGSLTNRGTVNWLDGALSLYYQAGNPSRQGQVWNQPGAVIDIQCDQSLVSSNGIIGTLHNAGLLRKSGPTGITSLLASIDNTGTVLAQTGTIGFNAGGELAGGIYQAAGGAQIYFAGGGFKASGLTDWRGPGDVCITGGMVELLDAAGTLAMCGGSIFGQSRLQGTLNWSGGELGASGSLSVGAGGELNLAGPANKSIFGSLTNRGTVNWLDGAISLGYQAGHPSWQGQVWNQPGAVIDIQCDQSLVSSNSLIGTLHNAGLLRKTGQAGTTSLLASIDNTGTVLAQIGAISFTAGGELAGGIYEALGGAQIYFADGAFKASGLTDWRGPGDVCITGGTVELLDAAGTLAMCGGTIVEQSRLQGTLNWRGGELGASGSLTVATGGELNLAGPANKIIYGSLTNRGAVNWLDGTISLYYQAGHPSWQGQIWNQPGAVIDIRTDQSLVSGINSIGTLHNAGLLRKSGQTRITGLLAYLDNTGIIEARMGTLSFLTEDSNTRSGNLAISLGSTAPGSGEAHLHFNGPLTLNGTFTVSTRNGFLPNAGNRFQVLTFPSATNDFDCINGLDLGDGLILLPQFAQTSLTLVATKYEKNAARPELLITRSPAGVRIVWPTGFPGWVLQSTTNVASSVWAPVSGPCANQALFPITLPQQYFRLGN